MQGIARGKFRLAANHDWSRDRINVLNLIFGWLKDDGQKDAALELGNILLERSELSDPLRYEIQKWVDNPGAPWRIEIDRCIRMQRPFRLTYQDAADRLWDFTIRHARIARHEDRQYLDCWCEETEGNVDIDSLRHNRSLRLDRIPEETLISRAEGSWQPELGSTEAEFHLLEGLAFAYRSKTAADVSVEWLPDRRVKRVRRRIHSTFWFFREIRRYGVDCIVIGPEEVRSRFARDAMAIAKHYS